MEILRLSKGLRFIQLSPKLDGMCLDLQSNISYCILIDLLRFFIYFVYSNYKYSPMQVSDPFRASKASRFKPPFNVSQHPIQFSNVQPAQYPLQFSNIVPQQISPIPIASIPPRTVQAGTSFHTLPPILYPQYQQPLYPQGQPYLHPNFIAQPITVIRRPAPGQGVPQVDESQVRKLCEVQMVQNTIFCVVCGSEYKTSQKEQHIKKHTRKNNERRLNQEALHTLEDYHKRQPRSAYVVKPIVQPQEVDVNFDPIVFELIQEIIYEDESIMSKKQAAIGQQGNNSFSYFDNNVSISHNQPIIHPTFGSEPNPFISNNQQHDQYHIPDFSAPPNSSVHVYGNTLNVYNEGLLQLLDEAQARQKTASVQQRESHHSIPIPVNENVAINVASSEKIAIISDEPLVYQSEHPRNGKTSSLFSQNKPTYKSQRYDSTEFKGFPPEQLEKIQIDPIERQQSFSGPMQVQPPNERSKRSSEVNVSQFIRELNAETLPVEKSLKKIPYQSQW